MPSQSDAIVETQHATIETDEFGRQKVTPKAADFNNATEDKDGNVILSDAIRKEQKDAGYVPDIQPKCATPAMTPVTGVAGSAVGGDGPMQPTGNILVAAAQAASDDKASK